jgi:immune inhibitor A
VAFRVPSFLFRLFFYEAPAHRQTLYDGTNAEKDARIMTLAARFRGVIGGLLAGVLGLLAACGSSPPTHTMPPYEINATPPPGLSAPQLLAWHVLHDVRPVSNPIALALSVKHVAGPINAVTRTGPLNEKVGADEQFWVAPGQQISATLVYITSHVYDYVEDGVQVDLGALKASADRFESSILVTDHRYFGTEWTPGVDDDVHITLLNAIDLPGDRNGTFTSINEYPQSVYATSNQREMIMLHLGADYLTPNTDGYDETLAHEFERMIQWHMRPGDPTWLREGAAMLAQHINGFDVAMTDTAFLAAPGMQLNTWPTRDGSPANYGAAFLFMDYFAEHYGGYPVLLQLMNDPAQAPLNFNDVLAANGYTDRFDDVFAKWVMANVLNDVPQSNNSAYVYKTVINEHATPQHMVTALPYHDQGSTPQYSAQYYDVPLPGGVDQTLHIAFSGQPTVALVSAPPLPNGATTFWWGNRGENLDATLTRPVDLTKLAGQAVTLTCDLWYDLEADYDYGYIEVSTDGGATWTPLSVTDSHTDDPNGLNLGNGLTGASNGWVPISVDLSAYAGKAIQVRFAQETDDMADGQGMAVANIAIPQANFTDAPTSTTGWTAHGWLAANNTLAQTYQVQAAIFGSDGSLTAVQPMPVDATGAGHLDVPHIGTQVSRVMVAVAPTAPATTIPAAYTLDLTAS